MPIFANHPDLSSELTGGFQQWCTRLIQFADTPFQIATGRSIPLGIIIEMGQVHQRKRWLIMVQDSRGSLGDPLTAPQAG
jgi:hypothetical protein